jgi:hypothetical protein
MPISRCCAGKRCVGAKTTSRPYRPQIRPFRILSTIGQRTTGAPLLAVADRAGSEWPKRARDAALDLSGVARGSIRGLSDYGSRLRTTASAPKWA